MSTSTPVPKSIDSVLWQDHRSADIGIVIVYASDPVSELPIRKVPDELSSPIPPEPHYETGTYGFYGCVIPKTRTRIVRARARYIFFLTHYEGRNADRRDTFLVTGYYRIHQVADVQKLHLRYLPNPHCISTDPCWAFKADAIHFVDTNDAFEVTQDVMDTWGKQKKITSQTRIELTEEHTQQLREYLDAKPTHVAQYIEETKRLQPVDPQEQEEEDA
jgi:hypothetical protein